MIKKEYKQAELEILSFDCCDVIVTSGEGLNETPKMPIGGTSGGAYQQDIDREFDIFRGY